MKQLKISFISKLLLQVGLLSFLFFSPGVKGVHSIPAGCPNGPSLQPGQPAPTTATCQAQEQIQQQIFQQQTQQNQNNMNIFKGPMGPPGGGMMGSPMGGPMGPPGGGMMGSPMGGPMGPPGGGMMGSPMGGPGGPMGGPGGPMGGPGGPMGGPGGPMGGGPGGPLTASVSPPGAPRPGFTPPVSAVNMAPSFSRNFVSQTSPSSGVSFIRQSPLR